MKILIIVGHQNVKYNSIVSLRGNTGTAGELEINKRIGDRVSEMLRERAFEVVQTDANANDDKSITSVNFNLALALHCDMDTSGQGGMCGSGDKSVDAMWQESLRIKQVFDATYFQESGIKNKNFVTEGMSKYYIWQYLTSKTPCVLLEMGEAKDAHDSVLLSNTELIASSIVRSICKAFNVAYDNTPAVDYNALLLEKDKQIQTLQEKVLDLDRFVKGIQDRVIALESELTANLALVADWQKQALTANKLLKTKQEELDAMTASKNQYKGWYEKALADQVGKYTPWQLIRMGINLLIKKGK